MFTRISQRFGGAYLVVAITLSVALLIGVQASSGDAKPTEESVVEKMMQAAHKGKKNERDAPLEIVQDEVKKDTPDWDRLVANAKPLAELGAAIKDNRSYTSNPAPYIAAVQALTAAAEKKDVAAARTAVAGLMTSCAGCHKW